MADKFIRVKYVKSTIGYNQKQKDTVASLGLRKLGQVKTLPATDAVLGMCRAVPHLVSWEAVSPDESEG